MQWFKSKRPNTIKIQVSTYINNDGNNIEKSRTTNLFTRIEWCHNIKKKN